MFVVYPTGQWIILKAVFIPVVALTLVIVISYCTWKNYCRQACRPIPDPKFIENIEEWKNGVSKIDFLDGVIQLYLHITFCLINVNGY